LREAAVKLSFMKKINPFLWFDSEVEQAAKFYVGIPPTADRLGGAAG